MDRRRLQLGIIGTVIFLGVWEIAGWHLGDALLAPPSEALGTLAEWFRTPHYWRALGALLGQTLAAYLLAMLVGVPLGILMGRWRPAEYAVQPWASMFVVTSAAALVPLFMMLLGRGMLFLITLTFMATVWYVTLTLYQGARSVPPKLLDVARSFGSSKSQQYRMVILPALYPYVLISAQVGLMHAMRAAVLAQMFVVGDFGGLILDAGMEISTASLLGLLITLMAVGLTFRWGLEAISRVTAPWYESRISSR